METNAPPSPAPLLAGTCLTFEPVPQQRCRADGWTPATQLCFIRALEAMGSVGQAARAVGMGRRSAYRLRDRLGAESFARAWDQAISMGRMRQFDYAMDRALNGVTTVRVLRGGAIDVTMDIVNSALREDGAPLKATKDSFWRCACGAFVSLSHSYSASSSFGLRISLTSSLSILRPSISTISKRQPRSRKTSPSLGRCFNIASACPAAVA
jgi:hypothetical protein